MKKTYESPIMLIVNIQGNELLIGVSASTEFNKDDYDYVKGDRGGRGSRSDYNVWNEDWSQ